MSLSVVVQILCIIQIEIDSENIWISSESCSFMNCDLDLGVEINGQRQDIQNHFMCNADTTEN